MSTVAEPALLSGRALRYLLTVQLFDHGPLTLRQLAQAVEQEGFDIEGRPSKTISDALRWEVAHGRSCGWVAAATGPSGFPDRRSPGSATAPPPCATRPTPGRADQDQHSLNRQARSDNSPSTAIRARVGTGSPGGRDGFVAVTLANRTPRPARR